ncbi:unnamed protein product [Prunus armeniaca]|uniref:Uncharacterized protein n=1 Tax=Prunus armeniaca TaxID=36596 RepID=A0A6J5V9Y7_PRUAR|nr:unnamed protein product [Prunus armeniaca]CAB4314762.1 unnamed protein product [Prunus armeniaca]
MEGTELGAEQKQLLHTSAQCQYKLNKILDDSDLDTIIDGDKNRGYKDCKRKGSSSCLFVHSDCATWTWKWLSSLCMNCLSQVMIKSNARSIRIVHDVAEEIMNGTLYGGSLGLQQVLADFLAVSINVMPNGGQLTIAANLRSKSGQLRSSGGRMHIRARVVK